MNIETKTIKQARAAYRIVSRGRLPELKKEISAARTRWSDACLERIEKVSTIEEAIAAFRISPWGSPAKEKALEKWVELCATIKELRHAHQISCKRFGYKNPALEKWDAISCIEVHTARNADELVLAFRSAPGECDDEVERISASSRALSKLLDGCSTLEEMYAVKNRLTHGCSLLGGDLDRLYDDRYEALHLRLYGKPLERISLF